MENILILSWIFLKICYFICQKIALSKHIKTNVTTCHPTQNLSACFKTCHLVSKLIILFQNLSSCFKTYYLVSKLIILFQNLSCFKTYHLVSKLVTPHKTYQLVSKLISFFQNLSSCFKTYQLVSKLIIMYNMCFPIQICNPARLYKTYHLV